MAEPAGMHEAVRAIVDEVTAESVVTLRSSAAARMLQPGRFGGAALRADAYLAAVCEIAALDATLGWLVATCNAAAYEIGELPRNVADDVWGTHPDALVTTGCRVDADLGENGRLTGRWECVAGAENADWLLLSIDGVRRVLVPRESVRVEPTDPGRCEVSVRSARVDKRLVFDGLHDRVAVTAGAGVAAAVVGTADGMWRTHVDQMRSRLATSHGGDQVTNAAAAQLARAASDIDAARLQIVASLERDAGAATWAHRQAVARARDAADRLLATSRHALDASDPVAGQWKAVHAGARMAGRLLDELNYVATQSITE